MQVSQQISLNLLIYKIEISSLLDENFKQQVCLLAVEIEPVVALS
jgi:hypothetical protein